jgi:hypothetical protein
MNKDLFKNIIINCISVLILLSPLIELINGFMLSKFNFSALSLIVRSLFLFLPIFLIMYLPVEKGSMFICFFSFILLHMFLRLFRIDIGMGAVMFDLQYTARSVLLLVSMILFVYALPTNKATALFSKYFLIQWVVITMAIILHITLGFGGVTYQSADKLRQGFTSYFQSGNQIVFLYVASWWVIALTMLRSLSTRGIFTIITLAVMLAMGTRSGIVLIFIMSGAFLFIKIHDKSRKLFTAAFSITLAASFLIFINFNSVMVFLAGLFVKYSSEAVNLSKNVDTYGALTALVSKRDLLVANALHAISNYDLRDILIGANFYSYKKAVGSYVDTREIRMAEVDPVDLMGGFGIIGLLVVYVPMLYMFIKLIKKRARAKANSELLGNNNLPMSIQGLIVIIILASSMSGHVVLSPLSIMCVGLTLAMAWHLIRRDAETFEINNRGF